MRSFLIGLSAIVLAGCGTAAVNNSSGNVAAPGNAAAPAQPEMPGNLAMPGGEDDAGGAPRGGDREELLASCTQEAGIALPAGTDVARLCGCAVERAMAGTRRADAMRQCAAEQNVRLPTGG